MLKRSLSFLLALVLVLSLLPVQVLAAQLAEEPSVSQEAPDQQTPSEPSVEEPTQEPPVEEPSKPEEEAPVPFALPASESDVQLTDIQLSGTSFYVGDILNVDLILTGSGSYTVYYDFQNIDTNEIISDSLEDQSSFSIPLTSAGNFYIVARLYSSSGEYSHAWSDTITVLPSGASQGVYLTELNVLPSNTVTLGTTMQFLPTYGGAGDISQVNFIILDATTQNTVVDRPAGDIDGLTYTPTAVGEYVLSMEITNAEGSFSYATVWFQVLEAGGAELTDMQLNRTLFQAGETLVADLTIQGSGSYTLEYTLQNEATREVTTGQVQNQTSLSIPMTTGGIFSFSVQLTNAAGMSTYAWSDLITVEDGSPYVESVHQDPRILYAGETFTITPIYHGDASRVVSSSWTLYQSTYNEQYDYYDMVQIGQSSDPVFTGSVPAAGDYRLALITTTDTGAAYLFDFYFDVLAPGQVMVESLDFQGYEFFAGQEVTIKATCTGEGVPANATWNLYYSADDSSYDTGWTPVDSQPMTSTTYSFTPDKGGYWRVWLETEGNSFGNYVHVHQGLYLQGYNSDCQPEGDLVRLTMTPVTAGSGSVAGVEYQVLNDSWEPVGQPQVYDSLAPFTYLGQPGESFMLRMTLINDLGIRCPLTTSFTLEDGSLSIDFLSSNKRNYRTGETVTVTAHLKGEGSYLSSWWTLSYSKEENDWNNQTVLLTQEYDGSNSYSFVPDQVGCYYVTLTLTSETGSVSEHTAVLMVGDGSLGVEHLTQNGTYFRPGQDVTIRASLSGEGRYTAGQWTLSYREEETDWANEVLILSQDYTGINSFTFVPEQEGYYYVTLTLSSETGKVTECTTQVCVTDGKVIQTVNISPSARVQLGKTITFYPVFQGEGEITSVSYTICDFDFNVLEVLEGTVESASYTPTQAGEFLVDVVAVNDSGYESQMAYMFQVTDGSLTITMLQPDHYGPYDKGDTITFHPVFEGEGYVEEGIYYIYANNALYATIPYDGPLSFTVPQTGVEYSIQLEIVNDQGISSSMGFYFVADPLKITDFTVSPDNGKTGTKTMTVKYTGGKATDIKFLVSRLAIDPITGAYTYPDGEGYLAEISGNGGKMNFTEAGTYEISAIVKSETGAILNYHYVLFIYGDELRVTDYTVSPKTPRAGSPVTVTPEFTGDGSLTYTRYDLYQMVPGTGEFLLVNTDDTLSSSFTFIPASSSEFVLYMIYTNDAGHTWDHSAYFTVAEAQATEIQLLLNDQNVAGTTVNWDIDAQGNTADLAALVLPEGYASQDVTWTTSAKAVATVEDGTVTFLKPGTVKITAKANDGSRKTAVVTFQVSFRDDVKKFTGMLADTTDLYGTPSKKGVQVGDSVQLLVYGSDPTTPLEGLTYELVSAKDEAYVSLDGNQVYAWVAGKTVRVKAYWADDPLNRSVTISVKTIAAIPGALELSCDAEAVLEEGYILSDGMEGGILRVTTPRGKDKTFTLTLTGYDGVGEVMDDPGKVTWKSSSSKIATVKQNKDGTITLTIKKGASGPVTITATSGLDKTVIGALTVDVQNYVPSVSAKSVTVNTYKIGHTPLGLVYHEADPVVSVTFADKKGNPINAYGFHQEDGVWYITDPGSVVKNSSTAGVLTVTTQHGEVAQLSFTIRIANKAPSITIKQTQKLNLLDANSYALFTITSKEGPIGQVTLSDDMEALVTGNDSGVIRLDLMHDILAVPKPDLSGKFTVEVVGYRFAVVKSASVSTEKVKNKAVLGATTLTLSLSQSEASASTTLTSYWKDLAVDSCEIEPQGKAAQFVTLTWENGQLTATLTEAAVKTASYKFNLYATIDGQPMTKITITVKIAK